MRYNITCEGDYCEELGLVDSSRRYYDLRVERMRESRAKSSSHQRTRITQIKQPVMPI